MVFPQRFGAGDLEKAAALMDVDAEVLRALLVANGPVPLYRASDETSASDLSARLAEAGFECCIVADTSLKLNAPNTRLRRIVFEEERVGFEDFNTGEQVSVAVSDVRLLVAGTIRESRVDVFQKRPAFGGVRSSGESQISGDDAVLDLYIDGMDRGFHVTPSGFDFSCLGSEKGPLARENWTKLLRLLTKRFPAIATDVEYDGLARAIGAIWPVKTELDTKGLVNSGFGKKAFGRSERHSNAEQFLRYSRLRWHLYEK